MTSLDDLANAVRERYPLASVSVAHLVSGASALDVVLKDRLFVVEHRPGEGFGVSQVKDDEGFLHGHQDVSGELSWISNRLFEMLERSSGVDGSGRETVATDQPAARRVVG
jgi:hypothetical protein